MSKCIINLLPPVLPDVPQLRVRFISDSPRVNGSTVEADFILTRPAFSVTCQISRHRELNCKCSDASSVLVAVSLHGCTTIISSVI